MPDDLSQLPDLSFLTSPKSRKSTCQRQSREEVGDQEQGLEGNLEDEKESSSSSSSSSSEREEDSLPFLAEGTYQGRGPSCEFEHRDQIQNTRKKRFVKY